MSEIWLPFSTLIISSGAGKNELTKKTVSTNNVSNILMLIFMSFSIFRGSEK
jgi:hypothetical protein